jgi:hypothetical protein
VVDCCKAFVEGDLNKIVNIGKRRDEADAEGGVSSCAPLGFDRSQSGPPRPAPRSIPSPPAFESTAANSAVAKPLIGALNGMVDSCFGRLGSGTKLTTKFCRRHPGFTSKDD